MAKVQGRVAKRYARALFDTVSPDKLESLSQSLNTLSQTWEENLQLRAAVLNPAIPSHVREEIIADVANQIRAGDKEFSNFTQILLNNQRLSSLPQIAQLFSEMVDQLKKVLALEVTSAFDLGSDEKKSIEDRVKGEFGNVPKVSWKTDRSLIGGLIIKVGDKLLDSSVRGSLEKLKSELIV